MAEEPTAMISLVTDGDGSKGGNGQGYKLQVSGDGQLTSYLKTLENVPESFYSNPHIITDMDESIIPQATSFHPRRGDAIPAIRLESSGQLDKSGSTNNERYYDDDATDNEDVANDESNDGRYEENESIKKNVYYDDDSQDDNNNNYKFKDRRERYSMASSRDASNYREAREYRETPEKYVVHRDYIEKERVPKEYFLPVENSDADEDAGSYTSSGRSYHRSRDGRETLASDEYIHLPRNAEQTYVIREREVVVPSRKELISDYLPVRDADAIKYGDADAYKYEDVSKYMSETPKVKYGYNLRDLLKELNTDGKNRNVQDNDQSSYISASDDNDGQYGVYRDAGSVYGDGYRVQKGDYMDGSDDGNDGNVGVDAYQEFLLSSAAGHATSAIKDQSLGLSEAVKDNDSQQQQLKEAQQSLSDQITNQQIQLLQQQQIQKEIIREKVLKDAKDRQKMILMRDAEQKMVTPKDKTTGEIKVEVKKDKDGKSKIVTTSSSSKSMSTVKGQGQQQTMKKTDSKSASDLKTLRTVLAKLIKQVEDIQSATARIISGNIDPLPVHNVSGPRSKVKSSSSSSSRSKGSSSSDSNKNRKKTASRSRSGSKDASSGDLRDSRSRSAAELSSKQSKVMLKASDLIKLLTGHDMSGDPFGSLPISMSGVRGARPAIPIAAMGSMPMATRVPAPFPFMPFGMFGPMNIGMSPFYPGSFDTFDTLRPLF